MAGSHLSVIVMPIVIALALTFWISLVLYASTHPGWRHHGRRPRTDAAGGVFEATHGARQLMPHWGEAADAIPPPRPATAAESYHPAGAQTAEQEAPATGAGAGAGVRAGASASGSRQSSESGPGGSGWPPV